MLSTNNLINYFEYRQMFFHKESIEEFEKLVGNAFMLNSLAIALNATTKHDDELIEQLVLVA